MQLNYLPHFGNAPVSSFASYEKTVEALKNNEIAAFVADRFFYFSALCTDTIKPTGIILHPDQLFFAFAKNKNQKLIETFDQNISKLKNNSKSEYYQSLFFWFDKKHEPPFPMYLVWIIMGFLMISLVAFSFVFLLRKEVARKTAALKISNENLRKAKEKAEESDRLKTEFMNNMSHEIRTPMNGILGFAQLLAMPDVNDAKQVMYIGMIQKSSKQLMRIINDIMEISRLETKQVKTDKKEVFLNEMLEALFSTFEIRAKEKGIALFLKKELSDTESTILTDDAKLNKILHNLLENAIKFTKEGQIVLGCHLKNKQLEIYVKDTGVGIKPESQDEIFKRFSQEKRELSENTGGLGLGLPIAKGNAKLLGGTITLESEKDKGSTFLVTIPYNPVFLDIAKRNKK